MSNERQHKGWMKVITKVLDYLQEKPDTVDRKSLSSEAHGMLRQKDWLVLKSDLLYRQCTGWLQDQPTYQFELPTKYQQHALAAGHDNVGHFGVERTSCLIKDQFYWSHMDEDIEKYVKPCS